jgi:hypothetical protein
MARTAANAAGTWWSTVTRGLWRWYGSVLNISVKYRMLPLTLNDDIVHGHTYIHDLPHLIFLPGKCREPNQIEPEAHQMHTQHPLCKPPDTEQTKTFYLLTQRLWLSSQMLTILDRSFVVLMAIDHKVHRRSTTFN